MVDCGERNKHIYQRAMLLVEQVKVSKGSPLVTCLLEGPSGRYACLIHKLVFIEGKLFELILSLAVVKLHWQLLLASIVTSHM